MSNKDTVNRGDPVERFRRAMEEIYHRVLAQQLAAYRDQLTAEEREQFDRISLKFKSIFIKGSPIMPYQSTKKYGHNVGFSCAFRQHRADSHCRFLHGYALAFEFTFESDELDVRNWVADFGGMKSLKGILEDTFDHKTLVATDDPHIEWFRTGHELGTLDLVEVPAGGCEKFAEMTFEVAEQWLRDAGYGDRVRLAKVQVWEHEANSASFFR